MNYKSEELNSLISTQISDSELFAERFAGLEQVLCREIEIDGFPVRLQFNPARAVSTMAKIDKKAIAERPCFLCQANRLPGQLTSNCFGGYDTLVNPFPIFRKHFTIANSIHCHQDSVSFDDMAQMAQSLPGFVVFFNGSTAGASAPDHNHFQAGEADFLPVCKYLNTNPGALLKHNIDFSAYSTDYLPINAIHFISEGVSNEMKIWFDTLLPIDENTLLPQTGMRNLLMWIDENQKLHTLFMPRKAHRPQCYFRSEEDGRLVVSPGAVDMAGVLILPRKSDFDNISRTDIRHIYDEVSFDFQSSSRYSQLLLL